MLLAGLPEDALLSRPDGQLEIWTQMHELAASGLEVASVTAAERKIDKPVTVTRPAPPRKVVARTTKGPDPERGEVGIAEAMAAFAANGRVRAPQPVGAR